MSAPVTARMAHGSVAARFLAETYGWPDERAHRVLAIANQVRPGGKAEPTDGGYVMITRTGDGYRIEDHTGRDISGQR